MEIKPFQRKANFYETDQMGVIHHSNYIRWFEEARVHYMEQIGFGYAKVNDLGLDFAVLSVSCRYLAMVRFAEQVSIEVTLTQLTPSRLTMRYRVYRQGSQELCCEGESRHCYYSRHTKRPVSLSKTLPELYHLFGTLCQTEDEPNFGHSQKK